MDFRWDINPLKSSVYLDVAEMKLVKQKLIADKFEDMIIEARVEFEDGNIEGAKAALVYDTDAMERDAEKRLVDIVNELENGEHGGDCTRQPISCMKCWAEHFAESGTVSSAPSGALSYIGGAFNGDATASDAIFRLRQYDPHSDWADVETIARWKAEATCAADWLERYIWEHMLGEEKA